MKCLLLVFAWLYFFTACGQQSEDNTSQISKLIEGDDSDSGNTDDKGKEGEKADSSDESKPFSYSQKNAVYFAGVEIEKNVPVYGDEVEKSEILNFQIQPRLPDGLNFDTKTGIVSGIPSNIMDEMSYKVTMTSSEETFQSEISFAIKRFSNNLWSLSPGARVNSVCQTGSDLFVAGSLGNHVGPRIGSVAFVSISDSSKPWEVRGADISGEVTAFASIDGGGYVIGGPSISIKGQPVGQIIRLSDEGEMVWAASLTGGSAAPFTFAVLGDALVVGGDFLKVNGVNRTDLASMSLSSGVVDSTWDPQPAGTQINDLTVDGSYLYVTGLFSSIFGENRSNVARFNISSLTLDSWISGASINGVIQSTVIHGGFLYVASRAGISNTRIFVITEDLTSGSTKTLNIDSQPDVNVNAMTIYGNTLVISGDGIFQEDTPVLGKRKRYLAAFDLTQGALLDWPEPDFEITALRYDGANLWIAGTSLLVIDGTTGVLKNQQHYPKFNGPISGMLIENGKGVITGDFTAQAIKSIGDLVRFDLVSGEAFDVPGNENVVYRIKCERDGLYVGNDMGLSHIDYKTSEVRSIFEGGAARDWVSVDHFLYIAGESLIALDTIKGTSLYTLKTQTGGRINEMVYSNDYLYIVGAFDEVGRVRSPMIARIEVSSGEVVPFPVEPNSEVFSIISQEENFFIGGNFSAFIHTPTNSSVSRPRAAMLGGDGEILTWQTPLSSTVHSMYYEDGHIYIGGAFDNGIAVISTRDQSIVPTGISITGGEVRDIRKMGDWMILGGTFTEVNGVPSFGITIQKRQ